MTETISINGKKFNLNVLRAKELGVLEELPAPFSTKDLENGDVFQWKHNRSDSWEEGTFVMLNKSLNKNGQAVGFVDGKPSLTWFYIPESSVLIRKWDYSKDMFVETAKK